MSSLSDKEVKESLTKNKENMTSKFNAFLILSKDIESIVKSNTTTWKNIYILHKPSEEVLQVDDEKDDEEDVEKDYEVINDDEIDNVNEEVNNEEDEED